VFYRWTGKLLPWFGIASLILLLWGLYQGLFVAPPDYQQGESYRIIFVHVPSAWMSLFIYVFMSAAATVALIWRIKTAEIVAMAAAPIGAAFTFVTLTTGCLWGKPMWGTWWIWDARLTSELVLLFIYLGVVGIYNAIEDRRSAARAACLMTLVGLVNIPIIHYSVEWWSTLHQGSTVNFFGDSKIEASMLKPLLIMAIATKLWFVWAVLQRARTMLLEQESRKRWALQAVGNIQ